MTELKCGDWILGQVLGEGLQGKVYRATHCRTGETSAIKFVFKDGMNDKDIKHLKMISNITDHGFCFEENLVRAVANKYQGVTHTANILFTRNESK